MAGVLFAGTVKMITSKEHLLAILNTVFNNFIFGMTLPQVVQDSGWSRIEDKAAFFEGPNSVFTSVKLQPMVRSVMDAREKEQLVIEYEKSLLRAMLRESYEAVMDYPVASGQLPRHRAQPWFQFARIMRNTVSHKDGGILREWPKDLTKSGITSVSWQHRVIDSSMVGKTISFSSQEGLHLIRDLALFTHSELE